MESNLSLCLVKISPSIRRTKHGALRYRTQFNCDSWHERLIPQLGWAWPTNSCWLRAYVCITVFIIPRANPGINQTVHVCSSYLFSATDCDSGRNFADKLSSTESVSTRFVWFQSFQFVSTQFVCTPLWRGSHTSFMCVLCRVATMCAKKPWHSQSFIQPWGRYSWSACMPKLLIVSMSETLFSLIVTFYFMLNRL